VGILTLTFQRYAIESNHFWLCLTSAFTSTALIACIGAEELLMQDILLGLDQQWTYM